MRRLFFAGLFPPPPLDTRLWLTVVGSAAAVLNLAYRAEIWPHTPVAEPVFTTLTVLLLMALVPQALWWAWGWLRGYTGPMWVRMLAKAAFMIGVCVVAAIWLIMLLVLICGAVTMLFKM